MCFTTEIISGLSLILLLISDVVPVSGKNCYNYKEDPRVRECNQGCCGEQYEQYCCDATMQIVGCVLGGLLVIAAIIAVIFFCYRSKSKRRGGLVSVPAVLGRLGLRSNANNNPHPPQARQLTRPPHRIPTGRSSHISTSFNTSSLNTMSMQYIQQPANYPPSYPGHISTIPPAPTAPLPPPYEMTVAPPPYAMNKAVPPPPTYNSIVSNSPSTHGYKNGEYIDNMPPPAD